LLTAFLGGPTADFAGGTPERSGAHGDPADEMLLAADKFGGREGHGKASCDGRDEDNEILKARHVV